MRTRTHKYDLFVKKEKSNFENVEKKKIYFFWGKFSQDCLLHISFGIFKIDFYCVLLRKLMEKVCWIREILAFL